MSANENDLGIFKGIELIPLMYEEIKALRLQVEHLEKELVPELDLTTRKGVRKYLNVSDRTITAFTSKVGEMTEGVHFIREYNGKKSKLRFISNAIIDFKKTYRKG